MASQPGKVSNPASPPFATPSGKAAGQGATASGARDFTTDYVDSGKGPGMIAKDRPQSEAKPEVVVNPQEVPAGGTILKADPGPVSQKVSGTAAGVSNGVPFKSLK